ncbi:unnamed protein product [Porites lobata]|uniref:Uncharacterized protein n=1 Tax=Porites lobata TaxID=104759 RepID=A0ABN8Q1F7_9CNID|nr:unnamed protein product [Porites lobata]
MQSIHSRLPICVTKGNNIKDVNTEVCEQLFSWLSRFSHITKHMNRWRFLFLMLYLLDWTIMNMLQTLCKSHSLLISLIGRTQ